ncbi:MAG TPA: exo-beta-N-acetylmuramidase NamZ domain-containing protein, partial [Acidobacteriota bacterium]
MVKPLNGIDILPRVFKKIAGRRNIALITGSANTDAAGRPSYEVVQRLAGARLKAIWSLQHGFFIDRQDNMVLSPSFFWSARGVEVRSLYGEKL